MIAYPIYRGLQKPLSYKGFKGKFIYWGIALLLCSLVLGALTMAIVNMYAGSVLMVLMLLFGFSLLMKKQKQGLHSKNRLPGIFIHAPKFKRYETKSGI